MALEQEETVLKEVIFYDCVLSNVEYTIKCRNAQVFSEAVETNSGTTLSEVVINNEAA